MPDPLDPHRAMRRLFEEGEISVPRDRLARFSAFDTTPGSTSASDHGTAADGSPD
jgi:hypothetical protein